MASYYARNTNHVFSSNSLAAKVKQSLQLQPPTEKALDLIGQR